MYVVVELFGSQLHRISTNTSIFQNFLEFLYRRSNKPTRARGDKHQLKSLFKHSVLDESCEVVISDNY